ncbi:Pre-mRNA-splicing factor RBM22 [Smittium mucronatum]|uniref:Pre-mRNA-splicing factor SLT11 n=1 Tax=Smittium mucronatum TaxID=133383 RepID=A0A1R0GTN3_9FUNG|nr:Pre-mRNA-splicing factor RBM22 [Smittium mucronatum]
MSKAEGKETWEDTDFPILCETCLGENPYVRMTKQKFGDECKICQRPFTVFRWSPGAKMRYKKTEICQTCATGLPVQVRDTALELEDAAPRSDVNRQFYNNALEKKIEDGLLNVDFKGLKNSAGREKLTRLARSDPYYKRNLPHICSFYVKGECKRGNECPYRHELPEPDGELSKQNIVDRYHGTNDPVAKKILARAKPNDVFTTPADKSITTLFVSGLDNSLHTEATLRSYFEAFGEIKSIIIVAKSKCGFINFKYRASAEAAADKSFGGCVINGKSVRMSWGKPKPKGPSQLASSTNVLKTISSDQSVADRLVSSGVSSGSIVNDRGIVLPPSITSNVIKYPSQDPSLQGSTS